MRIHAASRRRFLAQSSLALLGSTSFARLLEADVPTPPDGGLTRNLITEPAQRCIDQGLDYLGRTQHSDGSYGDRQYRGNVAVTSLAALALMAGGHQPGRGAHGKNVLDALKFILAQEDPQRPGYLFNPRHSSGHGPMYGHGFGTLFLAEVYGMVHNRKLREELHDKLGRAVELILTTQGKQGGWRYEPRPTDPDLSVTVCQIMALRAARNAGFEVPKSNVDRCVEYVKRSQAENGGFRYMLQGGQTPRFPLTAAGIAALNCAGIYKGDEITRGLRFLKQYRPGQAFLGRRERDMHYFYGHYYAAQVMWTAGEKEWSEWFPAIRDELVAQSRARGDGSWSDPICTHYATAMALLILQASNNYLSIFQK